MKYTPVGRAMVSIDVALRFAWLGSESSFSNINSNCIICSKYLFCWAKKIMVINDGNNAASMFSESIVESLEGRVDGNGKEPPSFNTYLAPWWTP